MIWLPYKQAPKIAAALVDEDLFRALDTVYDFLKNKPLPALWKKLWGEHKSELAKYGLILCKESDDRAKIRDIGRVRDECRRHLRGAEFVPPPWATEEICSNHRATLKYIGQLRALAHRIRDYEETEDIDAWLTNRGYPRLLQLPLGAMQELNTIMDKVGACPMPAPYQRFKEVAAIKNLWPSVAVKTGGS